MRHIARAMVASSVATAIVIAISACDTTYDVEVVPFLDDGGQFRGFQCVDDAGTPLTARIGSSRKAVIVMDVLDFGPNVLSCRPNAITDHCAQSGCPVLARICNAVDLAQVTSFTAGLKTAFAQLQEQDAAIPNVRTDELVMVRIIATTESTDTACASPGFPTLVRSDLVGCAYSCPARLNASGSVDVELDSLSSTTCEPEVFACATFETLGP